MADYDFRYSLAGAPEARQDGSGCVDHDIWAQYREGAGDWLIVPGRHKTVSVPAVELAGVLSAPTNAQKVAAYKAILASNINTQPQPITGWSLEDMNALVTENAQATEQAVAADGFITGTLGLSYPVPFAI